MAKEISLASNNAGVLAVRAGDDAAGFGALAEFLDQLARKTIQASNEINQQAMALSKLTSNTVRTQTTVEKYDIAINKSKQYPYAKSLEPTYLAIKKEESDKDKDISERIKKLSRRLEDLKQELDVGKVLASMSLVEASQAGKEFTGPLTDNAKNISSAIERIEVYVNEALKLVNTI